MENSLNAMKNSIPEETVKRFADFPSTSCACPVQQLYSACSQPHRKQRKVPLNSQLGNLPAEWRCRNPRENSDRWLDRAKCIIYPSEQSCTRCSTSCGALGNSCSPARFQVPGFSIVSSGCQVQPNFTEQRLCHRSTGIQLD